MAVAVAFYTSSFASLHLEYYSSDDFKIHFLCEVEHELDLSLILYAMFVFLGGVAAVVTLYIMCSALASFEQR